MDKDSRFWFASLLCYRLLICALVTTSFVPDEYYQTVEPAFAYVYSDLYPASNGTWEWSLEYKLRSYLPILHYIVYFKILKYVHLDNDITIRIGPRIIQSILASVTDYILYKICKSMYGKTSKVPASVLLIHIFSWSYTYCMCRTLANSLEANCVILNMWLWLQVMQSSNASALSSTTMYCVMIVSMVMSAYGRPTLVLYWLPLLCTLFYSKRFDLLHILKLFILLICISSVVAVMCILCDTYFYNTHHSGSYHCISSSREGFFSDSIMDVISLFDSFACSNKLTITPINFFRFNVASRGAELFGAKSWFWVLFEGVPVMLGLYTPVLAYNISLFTSLPILAKYIAASAVFYIVGLRAITSHMEYRFLLPILPGLHIFIGHIMHTNNAPVNVTKSRWNVHKQLYYLVFFIHMSVSVLLLTCHQAGAEGGFKYLLSIISASGRSSNRLKLIAPCYSFPGASYLYSRTNQIRIDSVDCSPYSDSNSNIVAHHHQAMPVEYDAEYVITFDAYVDQLKSIFQGLELEELKVLKHTYTRYDYDDPLFKENVHIYRVNKR